MTDGDPASRRQVVRDAIGIGVATGAYGLSFGAIATAAGFTVAQTCTLSLLMFTGGSQFALVSTVGGGGGAFAGAATAVLLGSRNALYGLRLSSLLRVRGTRRVAAAHLVIDESTAMALGQEAPTERRLAFWSTGVAVFVLWNVATVVGAFGGDALDDPGALGLDAAASAAFVALLAPRMRGAEPWTVAVGAAVVALSLTPLVAVGVPVLCAAVVAVVVGVRRPPARGWS